MTIADTRRLGIEFERRVQTMIPDTEFLDKLDTETIYSYLNQYQDKYVHEIYRNLDNIQSGTNLKAHVDSVLQSLLKTVTIEISDINKEKGIVSQHIGSVNDSNDVQIVDTARSIRYAVPDDYYLYVRSVSNVSKTYSFRASGGSNTEGNLPIRILPNQLVSQNDVWKLVETPHDSLRILRHPAAMITGSITKEDIIPSSAGIQPIKSIVNVNVTPYSGEDVDGDVYLNKDGNYLFKKQEDDIYYLFHEVWNNNFNNLVHMQNSKMESYAFNNNDGKYYITNWHSNPMLELAIGKSTLTVLYDQYTEPLGIKITYYKQPQRFSLMTSTPCELPLDAFEELVSGAVDLYVQYVAGAIANKQRLDEARKEAAKEAERNAARRGRQTNE